MVNVELCECKLVKMGAILNNTCVHYFPLDQFQVAFFLFCALYSTISLRSDGQLGDSEQRTTRLRKAGRRLSTVYTPDIGPPYEYAGVQTDTSEPMLENG